MLKSIPAQYWVSPAGDRVGHLNQGGTNSAPGRCHEGNREWFELYGQSHRHPVNVAIHKLAVPGIYLCALALLWCLPAGPLPPSLNWAALVAIPVLAFYLRLSFALFVGMTVLTALGLVICHSWQGPCCGRRWPGLCCSG